MGKQENFYPTLRKCIEMKKRKGLQMMILFLAISDNSNVSVFRASSGCGSY